MRPFGFIYFYLLKTSLGLIKKNCYKKYYVKTLTKRSNVIIIDELIYLHTKMSCKKLLHIEPIFWYFN